MDISPDKQNIDTLFASTTYYIDFYQRDYKWNKEPVERLLDDIFFKFKHSNLIFKFCHKLKKITVRFSHDKNFYSLIINIFLFT